MYTNLFDTIEVLRIYAFVQFVVIAFLTSSADKPNIARFGPMRKMIAFLSVFPEAESSSQVKMLIAR
jgi:hypothetical protein